MKSLVTMLAVLCLNSHLHALPISTAETSSHSASPLGAGQQVPTIKAESHDVVAETTKPEDPKDTTPKPSNTTHNVTDDPTTKPSTTTTSTIKPPETSTTAPIISTKEPSTSTTVAPTKKPTTPTVPPTPEAPTTSAKPISTSTIASTASPTQQPHHKHSKFDGASFIGGMILACGLTSISFVAFKFYKARTERNYHTL